MDAIEPNKVLVLTRYDRLGASSRVRFLQYLPGLAAKGLNFDVCPFFGDNYIRALYNGQRISFASLAGGYSRRLTTLLRRRHYDLIWLEKEALPWIPGWVEAALMDDVPYVIDLDDAWFHRYDQHRSALLRTLLGGKLDAVMRRALVVVAGNDYLANRARHAGALNVILIPSTVDLDRYPAAPALNPTAENSGRNIIIGWIGTPITASYLTAIEPAIRTIAAETPITLKIIGAQPPAVFAGLSTESVAWSEATEVEGILGFDIGIMPLADTPWEQGKCAFKLLQFMAAARPVIGSPVGANCQVVQHGVNGFLANSNEEWTAALRALISDPALRRRLGAAARQTVEQDYSKQKILLSLASVLKDALGQMGRTK